MSFINVNLSDKKSWLDTAENKFQLSSSPNMTYTMPSLFNFSNPYGGISYFAPVFNPWTFNFMPFNFSFTPSFNLFNFTPGNFSFTPTQNTTSIFSNLSFKTPAISTVSTKSYSKLTLKDADYNEQKGEKLARAVSSNAKGFNGDCALYVRLALEKCGLGTGERGDGYEYAGILSRNKNFKEISTSGLDLSDLPAGCVLVYNRGTAGYSSKYGHVEITLGNGKAASDGVTKNIKQGARVFVPV